MTAPDKIYIQPNAHDRWFEGNMPNDNFVEYIRKDALISFLEKEKDDLYNWHFQDEDRKFKVYEEVINKIKEL